MVSNKPLFCVSIGSVLSNNCFAVNSYSPKTFSSRMSCSYSRSGISGPWLDDGYMLPSLREHAKNYMETLPVRRMSCFLEYSRKPMERGLYEQ